MTEAVVTGRKWNNPKIYAEILHDGIEMKMSFEDFLTALAAEVGSPTFLMTRAGLELRIKEASGRVLKEMRDASAAVI